MGTQPQTIIGLTGKFLATKEVPCHVDEIAKYVVGHLPCKAQSISDRCSKDNKFIMIKPKYIGLRSKKYNLREWKKKNIAVFGTAVDFAEVFLAGQDTPADIDDIVAYVVKHRKCNVDHFKWRCNHDKRFIFIKPRFLGLRTKKYDLRAWEKRNQVLFGDLAGLVEKFLARKDRPGHLIEIRRYIRKYRDCTVKNLTDCVENDARFVSEKPGFIGLRSKKYRALEWQKQDIQVVVTTTDLIEEFLTGEHEPCHIDQIAKYVLRYRNTTASAMINKCSSDKRFFSRAGYIGLRAKNYDLTEWKEKHLALMGTPADLIEEFLTEKEDPCHIDEIARYVLKYRSLKADTLLKYCSKDRKKRFLVIGKYVRLKAKNYNLAEWKKQNLKQFGTISDFAEEYLAKKNVPAHVADIIQYIRKNSPKNDKWVPRTVMTVLLREPEKFIHIPPGFVGLQMKNYNLEVWRKQNIVALGTIGDLIHGFLTEKEVPCHVDEIAKYVLKHRDCKATNLLWYCGNDERFFIIEPRYVGLRKKEYNLKEWKEQNVNVFGSIVDIAADFVSRQSSLCHLKTVAQYVRKYRKTTASSVSNQMKRDSRFVLYTNKYFGLWGKDYDDSELEEQKLIKAGTQGDIVKQFLVKHKGPCHIDEITSYINKYRKVDSIWIMSVLKEDKRFNTLKNGNVRLRPRKKIPKKMEV